MTKYDVRRWIPLKLQRIIRAVRFREEHQQNEKLKKEILTYYKDTENPEIIEITEYLKQNPLSFFCYGFSNYAYRKKIKVYFDQECGMNYTVIEGKRLYFKKSMDKNAAQNYICSIFCEQNKKSPHSYHIDSMILSEIPVHIIDLGAAEGYFALKFIDRAKKVSIVECDAEWAEALERTFLPWKDKTTIIAKAVGGVAEKGKIVASDLLECSMGNIIKMDIEGMEVPVLRELVQSVKMENCRETKIIACTYHNAYDEESIKKIFADKNVKLHTNPGYVFFMSEKTHNPPYFRRGVMFIEQGNRGEEN